MKRQLLIDTFAIASFLLCTFTINAYDFKVGNLGYKKTSNSTVEVVFCDIINDDIEDLGLNIYDEDIEIPENNIDIPKQVTYNEVNYTVTSIGDNAFYDCALTSVTIPETVTSIGHNAFCSLEKVTCLASTPPDLNDSFAHVFILIVKEDAYYDYLSEYDKYNCFSHILCSHEGESFPIYFVEYDFFDGFVLVLNKIENSQVFYRSSEVWAEGGWTGWAEEQEGNEYWEYNCDYWIYELEHFMLRAILFDCFAIIDNKYYQHVFIHHQNGNMNNIIGLLYKKDLLWNICNNDIYYCFHSNYADESDDEPLSRIDYLGVSQDRYLYNYEYIHSYSGVVIVPEFVHFAIWDIPVASIDWGAFAYCTDLTSVTLPNTIRFINPEAFKGTTHLKKLVLPVSIISIAYNAFEDCSPESIHITGEGEWQGGELPESIKTLCIGSGVTCVNEMAVNPDTIYSYAAIPPICDECSFTDYKAELHVPATSLAAYFTAPYWCNFTNIVGDAVQLISLTLDQDSVEVAVGNQVSLTASITPVNSTPSTVSWQSSDTTVATVENGVITAVARGECDIVASCQDHSTICHVVVFEIAPTAVNLDHTSAKIEVGAQLTLTATVLPENATDKTVSWWSSDNSVATVNPNGMVTAISQGECDITATCWDRTAKCHLIVVDHFIFISLDQHETMVLPNHIITLTPTMTPVSTDLVVNSSYPDVAAARMAGNKIQVVGITEGITTILVNSSNGYAEPDSCIVTVYTERGDVNADGFVNIADVTALMDYMLIHNGINIVNSDCNNDGNVNISDVTLLVDHLLGFAELAPKALATASHIAPYMVFSDKSLQAMATEKPTTQAEFGILYGVGEVKCQKYWRPFTAAIRDYLATNN